MTKALRKVLKVWLAFRTESDKMFHEYSDFVFVSERPGQITTRAIAYVVDGYLEKAGMLERIGDECPYCSETSKAISVARKNADEMVFYCEYLVNSQC